MQRGPTRSIHDTPDTPSSRMCDFVPDESRDQGAVDDGTNTLEKQEAISFAFKAHDDVTTIHALQNLPHAVP